MFTQILAAEGGDGLADNIPGTNDLFFFNFWGVDGNCIGGDCVPLLGINKTVFLYGLAALISLALWFFGTRGMKLVPKGIQNVMESIYNFIREQVVIEVMGNNKAALKYVPFLATLFTFILVANMFEITPGILFPPTSRMAMPAFLAILVWIAMIVQGIASQGLGHYFGGTLFPAGVPKAMYLLVTPIELVSVFLVRPFSLAVRLFANMVAGHTLVTMFLVFTHYAIVIAAMNNGSWGLLPVGAFAFVGAIGMMGFEIFVSFIQAFIFTTLAAVYIGESIHGH